MCSQCPIHHTAVSDASGRRVCLWGTLICRGVADVVSLLVVSLRTGNLALFVSSCGPSGPCSTNCFSSLLRAALSRLPLQSLSVCFCW
jgi:hypothetical protein